MILWGIAMAIMLVALGVGIVERKRLRASFPIESLGQAGGMQLWIVVATLFVFEALGVAASLYLIHAILEPSKNLVILSILIAAANFGGLLSARQDDAPIRPQEIFLFFKDGLLWPAALPSLAATLGVAVGGE